MAEVVLNDENFEEEVLRSDKTVLVDFWAIWCGPCRMIAPVLEDIADEYEAKLKVGKVNVDEEPDLASRFHITSIPTLMIFKNGKIVRTTVGYHTKEQILALL